MVRVTAQPETLEDLELHGLLTDEAFRMPAAVGFRGFFAYVPPSSLVLLKEGRSYVRDGGVIVCLFDPLLSAVVTSTMSLQKIQSPIPCNCMDKTGSLRECDKPAYKYFNPQCYAPRSSLPGVDGKYASYASNRVFAEPCMLSFKIV